MSRAVLIAVAAGLLLALPSAAAPVGSGKIAYAIEVGSLYTVTADGRSTQPLRIGGTNDRLTSPRWSPNGLQVAFTEYRGDPNQVRLWVMGADETNAHIVATGAIALSTQPWSPDGLRIAWGPNGIPGDIYTASTAGGDVRRVTTGGFRKYPPVWSPTGSSLVYSVAFGGPEPERWELLVVSADGSGQRQITSGGGDIVRNIQPSWSPDGSTIAFLREVNPDAGIYVVRPDGTELHRVAETRPNPKTSNSISGSFSTECAPVSTPLSKNSQLVTARNAASTATTTPGRKNQVKGSVSRLVRSGSEIE